MPKVGADFGDSIFGAKLAATQAGSSLETSNVVTSNSKHWLYLQVALVKVLNVLQISWNDPKRTWSSLVN